MDDVEVRELRYFRAVADELNFSRAATRLGIAQPPLSRAIRQLERRIGVQLFVRDTRQVALTPAGHALLAETSRVFDAVSAAVHRTRRAGRSTPSVVVTAKAGVATELLRRIVRGYAELPGAEQVEVVVSGYGEQAAMLRDGRADLAFIGSPAEYAGFDTEPLYSEPRVAALPAGHELASRATLSCRDLVGLPMPQWPDATPAERVYWAGRDYDLPTHGPEIRDSSQLLENVALGQTVGLIPSSLAEHNPRPDIAYRPVLDASPYTTVIAWPAGSTAPWIARFVQIASSQLVTTVIDGPSSP
ncbi:LysR family transcriptional regulator [Allokutzneria sp. A3M-2-11 16]|uniref:LysR family transcriptional regulator n=1 Tax=Allokutzneria sp. A3M-2-11 16 TaxID=2962043 RepID=UPI0020B71763|nr:LysR family transcriptional regulator [Allokutzneria sp. A3M-2-11 16]MCP3804120.1 LysR family transcriptional regulator [Allokutzneria sp. A3M-2-11 16]